MNAVRSLVRKSRYPQQGVAKFAFTATRLNSQNPSDKKTICVVGCGWAGYRVATDLDKSKYDVKVISPSNHWVFTPLLPSTAVGTLEFRAIQEPVRTIKGIEYYQAQVDSIDFGEQQLKCSGAYEKDFHFDVDYDAVILAPGCETNTFGVRGLTEDAGVFFLKQLSHSRSIRNRLIGCFERASSPGVSEDEVKKLLTFVVVGGGPTSVEFAAELYDFLKNDVARWYPDLSGKAEVVICEASGHILGSFHNTLVDYVEKLFKSRRIRVLTSKAVTEVVDGKAVLDDGQEIAFGLMVWSTGVRQTGLIRNMPVDTVAKFEGTDRLQIDENLRVLANGAHLKQQQQQQQQQEQDGERKEEKSSEFHQALQPLGNGSVFALGDCAGHYKKPLPALAQVASQQGKYIAKLLNKHGLEGIAAQPSTTTTTTAPTFPAFKYAHLGSMAQVGQWKGVYDASQVGQYGPPVKGFLAFVLWRAAYWTKQVSLQNKMLIVMYWFKSFAFGRDISRF